MVGGEIYVKKIPSMKVTEIADVIAPEAKQEVVGIRPGEKLHEQMIGIEDAPFTYEYGEHFKILPAINDWAVDEERIKRGRKVPETFSYPSDNNSEWMPPSALRKWIEENEKKIGAI